MAQSFAISLGNANSYVASSHQGGVEILLNEYSSRYTPTCVAFNNQHRSMGTDAASNLLLNTKNTIFDLMVLLATNCDQIDTSKYPFKIEKGPDNYPLVVVQYLGEERKFTLTQILAMLFTKLRAVAGGATQCVMSYPQFFSNDQKDALVQAALIAGLKPMQILSEMAAVILNYAYYRTTKDDTHKLVAFVNFGQSNLQTAVAWINPKEDQVQILAAHSELIGGKDLDKCLASHFIKSENLTLSPKQYLKLMTACEKLKRLLSANSNDLPIHVESLISEEQDFTARINRAKFEELIQPILQQVENCLKRTVSDAVEAAKVIISTSKAASDAKMVCEEEANQSPAADSAPECNPEMDTTSDNNKSSQDTNSNSDNNIEVEMPSEAEQSSENNPSSGNSQPAASNNKSPKNQPPVNKKSSKPKAPPPEPVLPPDTISEIEMVGGSTRIPVIRQIIQKVFALTPSTTLNTDEAVARGCVLHCATLHPGMKVKREFKITGDVTAPANQTCNEELRRVELKLITNDRDFKARTEARNNLEELIYAKRATLKEDDPYLKDLNEALDWLVDEGEDAPREEYLARISNLKKADEAKAVQEPSSDVCESQVD